MDTEGDVHVGGMLLGERCTLQRSGPGSPAGAGVVAVYSSGERVSGLVYLGYVQTGPTHEKRVQGYTVPNSA